MKAVLKTIPILLIMFLLGPLVINAQNEKKIEKKVEEKIIEKELNAKSGNKEVQQIIIRKKGDKEEKIIIEIDGENVMINGKPAKDFNEEELKITMNKFKDFENLRMTSPRGNFNFNMDDNNFQFFSEDDNKAMLGVSTEKSSAGSVEIKEVVKESAAEKAGLKKGDFITKVDDKKIESPDDLTKAIGSHKPGDKVDITVLRDKKDKKINVELGKWQGMNLNALRGFSENIPNLKLMDQMMPHIQTMPRVQGVPRAPRGDFWMMDSKPKLGLSIQDTEDGKGVKVLDVDADGIAGKSGIRKDDLITHINDKPVNSADELAKISKEIKEGNSLMMKLLRNGKVQNFEVKIPKKLKTMEL